MTDAKTLERDERARAAFLAATEHEGAVPVFVPPPPRPAPPPQDWPHASIVRRSIAGDDEDATPRLPSLEGLLSAMAQSYDYEAPIRSSAAGWEAYGLYGGMIGTTGHGKLPDSVAARDVYSLAHRELLRIAGALPARMVASGHAFDGPAQMRMWAECHGPGALIITRIKGGPERKVKGMGTVPASPVVTVPERRKRDATTVSEGLAVLGIVATAHEVGVICRGVTAKVEAAFVARGWVRERRKSIKVEADVAKNEERIEGWKSIAPVVGRSEDTCAKLSRRAEHPLPAGPLMGRIVAYRSELLAWVDAEIERERLARRSA